VKYLIKLTPLKPFFFGGDTTFGKLGDKDKGTYLVKSRLFPQQTAILGMIRKEMLIQKGFLTTKINYGEWVDEKDKKNAKYFIGDTKFEFNTKQDFGVLKNISPIFLLRGDKKFIKKVDIDSFKFILDKNKQPLLENYNPKEDIYDNFISIDNSKTFKTKDIFRAIEEIGIKKITKATAEENEKKNNSYFKKTSYTLKHNFKFAFFIESDFELEDAFITLGGEKSTFKMEVTQNNNSLEYKDKNGYLILLSDAYLDIDIKENCDFAITSEISFNYLQNKFQDNKIKFEKAKQTLFLYEKGSIFINPKGKLIDNLNNQNLQKIGLNQYSYKKGATK